MGSTTSSIPAEPIVAVAALGALGYGYVQYLRFTGQSDDGTDASNGNATTSSVMVSRATSSALHGQKKRGRKLQLPGDATLKNLDILDAPDSVPPLRSVSASAREPTSSISVTRQQQQRQQRPAVQSKDVVPGGFDGAVASSDDVRHVEPQHQQQQQQQQPAKKQKKRKGKKTTVSALSDASSASVSSFAAASASQLTSGPTEGALRNQVAPATVAKAKKGSLPPSVVATDARDERWTRVEARRKKVAPTQTTGTDATTSDAGITTSVTGNSSPVTERTTEDELPPELDESVSLLFVSPSFVYAPIDFCCCVFRRSVLDVSTSSLPDALPRVVPVRPPPGEQPAEGFTWDDYEGVQDDEDASDDSGWGVVKSRRSQSPHPLQFPLEQV
jgi:hypothetical protein